MATESDSKTDVCIFEWTIESITKCRMKKCDFVDSPTFIADAVEGTKWGMRLYPMVSKDDNYFKFYLFRAEDCGGPKAIKINHRIALLDKDGLVSEERIDFRRTFRKPHYLPIPEFISKYRVFALLPVDTLTVRCEIWKTKVKKLAFIPNYLYGSTVFKSIRRYFVWSGNLNTLKSGMKKKFKERVIHFDFEVNDEQDIEKKWILNIKSCNKDMTYFSFKTFVVDSEGKMENCGFHEYYADSLEENMSLQVITEKLMRNESQFIQNDILTLRCEYVFATKTNISGFPGLRKTLSELTNEVDESRNELGVDEETCQSTQIKVFPDSGIMLSKLTKKVVETRDELRVDKGIFQSTLTGDIKSMYIDSILCDTEIRATSRNFQAHSTILCIRSPVLSSMLKNMNENNNGYVSIPDLEEDTVHRMLLYMYTDTLENLQIESATKLYVAAENYQIPHLKTMCSTFLKDNLCASNLCEIMAFADLQQDNDLKCYVKNYILENDQEVFGSEQWKTFMVTHLKLAADIMYERIQMIWPQPRIFQWGLTNHAVQNKDPPFTLQ